MRLPQRGVSRFSGGAGGSGRCLRSAQGSRDVSYRAWEMRGSSPRPCLPLPQPPHSGQGCPGCAGPGWVGRGGPRTGALPPPAPAPVASPTPQPPPSRPDPQPSGSPRGPARAQPRTQPGFRPAPSACAPAPAPADRTRLHRAPASHSQARSEGIHSRLGPVRSDPA